jgi:hypothetical protein
MKASRYVVIACGVVSLAACHSSGGGGGGGPPTTPPPSPQQQTYAVRVISIETVRAADQLALPVAGLPSPASGSIVVAP